jgi:hypothetical protein
MDLSQAGQSTPVGTYVATSGRRERVSVGGSTRTFKAVLAMTLLVIAPAWATSVLRFSLEELTDRAELIIHGTCTQLQARETPDGVVTDVTVAVTSALKGTPPATFTFTAYGGQTETRGTFVAGSPTFEQDEEVVLFLDRENDRGFRLAIGMAQGKYTVREEDGRKVASRNLAGLRFVDPKTNEVSEADDEPEPGVALDELLKTIKGHLARERR